MHNPYYDKDAIAEMCAKGAHREAVGGLWDEMGRFQLDFLIAQGLTPEMRLLDVGCGSLRLGRLAVDYLAPEHYFGTDICKELLEMGYEKELSGELQQKLPRAHLVSNDDFDFSFLTKPVDMAVAQSLFSHLPLNHIRRCLIRLYPHMANGGSFFATYHACPDDVDITQPRIHRPGDSDLHEFTTHDIQDSYHYSKRDIAYAAELTDWRITFLGDWNHPRGQHMLIFHKD